MLAEDELDAVRAKDLGERIAERRGLAGEQVARPSMIATCAAEAAYGLSHLDADRPTAEHEQAAGHGLHPRHLAVRPDRRRARGDLGSAG